MSGAVVGTPIFKLFDRAWLELYRNDDADAEYKTVEDRRQFLSKAVTAVAYEYYHKMEKVLGWNLLAYYTQPFTVSGAGGEHDDRFLAWASGWALAVGGHAGMVLGGVAGGMVERDERRGWLVVEDVGPLARLVVGRQTFAERGADSVETRTVYRVEEFKVHGTSGCTLWYRHGELTCVPDVDGPARIDPYANVAVGVLALFDAALRSAGRGGAAGRVAMFRRIGEALTPGRPILPYYYRLPMFVVETDVPLDRMLIVRLPCGPTVRIRCDTGGPVGPVELVGVDVEPRVCVRHL